MTKSPLTDPGCGEILRNAELAYAISTQLLQDAESAYALMNFNSYLILLCWVVLLLYALAMLLYAYHSWSREVNEDANPQVRQKARRARPKLCESCRAL